MEFNLYFNNLKPETKAEIHTDLWERVENDDDEMAEIRDLAEATGTSIENLIAEKVDDIINRGFNMKAWVTVE